jgi:putative sigma-54 modulation protein
MNVEFIGKAVEWTDAMKSFVEGKLERFSRLLKEAEEDQVEVVVTLSTSRGQSTKILPVRADQQFIGLI